VDKRVADAAAAADPALGYQAVGIPAPDGGDSRNLPMALLEGLEARELEELETALKADWKSLALPAKAVSVLGDERAMVEGGGAGDGFVAEQKVQATDVSETESMG